MYTFQQSLNQLTTHRKTKLKIKFLFDHKLQEYVNNRNLIGREGVTDGSQEATIT